MRSFSLIVVARKLSITLIYFVFFSQLSLVFAAKPAYLNSSELSSFGFTHFESINPNLLIYPFKRLLEEIKLNLVFNPQKKKEYMYHLYEARLSELVYIINNRKEGFIPFTADRYNSFAGRIKKGFQPEVNMRIRFQDQIRFLERLRDIYPANSPNWEKLQQTIDTTKSLI